MKQNLVLFGAGFFGRNAYYKFKKNFHIVCFVDNNKEKAGEYICGIPIICFEQFKEMQLSDKDIVICTSSYEAIETQLASIGVSEYYVFMEGFLYLNSHLMTMAPIEVSQYDYYKKSPGEKNILFVQNAACIRTHKIATIMKRQGFKVFLLYMLAPPESNNGEFEGIYDATYDFSSANGLVDFVDNSDFDIVHSSNAPDMLTNLLLATSKPVVHDTHDMNSIWGNDNLNNLVLEHIANTHSAGNIYTSEGVTNIASEKYDIRNKPVFTLENVILEQVSIGQPYEKLSEKDGEIHCVYEGGINGVDRASDRFFEDIWKQIVAQGIHIHFYSQGDESYCKKLEKESEYLHFEGNMGSQRLIKEMTRYDCGLALFHITERNRLFMETGTANKVYEYINAGLPVAVGDIQSYKDFVEGYGVGKQIDFTGDLKKQFQELIQIKISPTFLEDNGLTMMSKAHELVKFYEQVMQSEG